MLSQQDNDVFPSKCVSTSGILTCCYSANLQLDAGIRGKAPGAETAAYIKALDSQLRVIGAACIAIPLQITASPGCLSGTM